MCIDKKLLIILFLAIISFNLALAQSSGGDNQPTDTQEMSVKNVVDIYPNPTADYLHVEIKDSELSSIKFEMYNIIGNAMAVEYEQIGRNLFRIPVGGLATGYYLIIVKDEDTRYRKALKFMKI